MNKIQGEWLTNAATQRVAALLTAAGFQAYFVGGCVRNALLEVAVNDIDMCTNAHPNKVVELAESAGLKAIPTGIDHGTITVVCDKIPFEITTLRKDISTDGRHAKVEFSNDIRDDAKRRDFTMNAIYAEANGSVVDPIGGLRDLLLRKVRFVGEAQERINEDYLRILRFFRFHAWYGDAAQGIDPDGLAACAEGVDGIAKLSPERIGSEMIKLLSAVDPAPAIASMAQAGVLNSIMPGADPKALAPLIHLEDRRVPDWRRRAMVLGGFDVSDVWRLSKKDKTHLAQMRTALGDLSPPSVISYAYGRDCALNTALARAAMMETALDPALDAEISLGETAVFPVKAADLPSLTGRSLGHELKRLEAEWIASGFTKSKEELLTL